MILESKRISSLDQEHLQPRLRLGYILALRRARTHLYHERIGVQPRHDFRFDGNAKGAEAYRGEEGGGVATRLAAFYGNVKTHPPLIILRMLMSRWSQGVQRFASTTTHCLWLGLSFIFPAL